MYPNDPIYNKLSQSQIDRIYWEKYLMATFIKPKCMIEIGVRTGYSAIAFFKAIPKLKYYGFDCSDVRQAGNKKYIEHAKKILKGYNFILREEDTFTLKTLGISNVDFVSVDGNHTYKYVLHDLLLALNAVKDKGFVMLDDISYIRDVKKALDDFVQDYREAKKGTISRMDFQGVRGFSLLKINKN